PELGVGERGPVVREADERSLRDSPGEQADVKRVEDRKEVEPDQDQQRRQQVEVPLHRVAPGSRHPPAATTAGWVSPAESATRAPVVASKKCARPGRITQESSSPTWTGK